MSEGPAGQDHAPRSSAAAAIDPHRHTGPALRSCRRIGALWDLSAEETARLIGVPADVDDQSFVATLHELEGMSLILGVYRSTVELYGHDGGPGWVRTAHVDGRPVLAILLWDRAGLWRVRRLLLDWVERLRSDPFS